MRVKLVTLLPVTALPGGRNITVLWSKLPGPRAVFVGRPSLDNTGGGLNLLKSAWNDTGPPAKCGKRAGATVLISMPFMLVKVMSIPLPIPKSVGSSSVTA